MPRSRCAQPQATECKCFCPAKLDMWPWGCRHMPRAVCEHLDDSFQDAATGLTARYHADARALHVPSTRTKTRSVYS